MKDAKLVLDEAIKRSRQSTIIGYTGLAALIIGLMINYYFGESMWVTIPVAVIAITGLIVFSNMVRRENFEKKRYQYLKKHGKPGEGPMIITDRFIYMRLLKGDEGALDNHYCVVTKEGNWRLHHDIANQYNQLIPGTNINASYLSSDLHKEIVDLEITASQSADTKPLVSKYMSEARITGVDKTTGDLTVTKLDIVKTMRYYHVINHTVLEVSKDAFLATASQEQLVR